MLQLIQQAALGVGSATGAITDAKTGYLYDWLTYPMLAIGAILSITQQQWNNLFFAAIIFAALYLTYRTGKIGGGDVKMYTAIALLNPINDASFLMTAIFFAAMSAMVFYPAYYGIKYARKGINVKENKEGIQRAIIFGAIITIYFAFLAAMNLINPASLALIGVPLLFGLIFIALQNGITKNFFEKKITLSQIEDDEVLSDEKNPKKVNNLLKGKKLIGEKEKQILKKNGIKSIYVLRGLPPFGPFIFIGVVAALIQPGFIMFLFA